MRMENEYDVSVCLITYNQENFIERSLLSIIEQVGNFSFEILVGDDASSDNTFEVLSRVQSLYPRYVKIFRRVTNVGPTHNLGMLICEAKGKYIAILEGDDHWLTDTKLYRQIRYMEDNSDVNLCFHTAIVCRNGYEVGCIPPNSVNKENFNFSTLLRFGPFIHLSSVFFRRSVLPKLPGLFFLNRNIVDYSLLLILSEGSKIGYLGNIYSVYNFKSSPLSWSSANDIDRAKQSYEYVQSINSHYSGKYQFYLSKQLAGYVSAIFLMLWRAGEYRESIIYFNLLFSSKFALADIARSLIKIVLIVTIEIFKVPLKKS